MKLQLKLGLLLLLAFSVAAIAEAQTAPYNLGNTATVGLPLGQDARVPNTFLVGMRTAVSYDTNAFNGPRPVANTEYTVYPYVGLDLSRVRWDATLTYMPGVSYSTANIPSYNVVSQMVGAAFQYRATQKLTIDVRNSFLSSSNPFDSLYGTTQVPQFGVLRTPTSITWNYLPKTNELVGVDGVYALSARTSIHAGGSFNYLTYTNGSGNNTSPGIFDTANSTLYTLGIFHVNTRRYSSGFLYTGQHLDSGHGVTTTTPQSVAYVAQFQPRPSLQLSGMVGPQYADTRTQLGPTSIAYFGAGTNWSWMGAATMSWTHGRTGVSVSAIRELSTGSPYQGNVRQSSFNAQIQHEFAKRTTVNLFAAYNITNPLFRGNVAASTLSNNYLSSGAGVSKQLSDKLAVSATYWYLGQNNGAGAVQPYSGNHNRIELSLSYLLVKPFRR